MKLADASFQLPVIPVQEEPEVVEKKKSLEEIEKGFSSPKFKSPDLRGIMGGLRKKKRAEDLVLDIEVLHEFQGTNKLPEGVAGMEVGVRKKRRRPSAILVRQSNRRGVSLGREHFVNEDDFDFEGEESEEEEEDVPETRRIIIPNPKVRIQVEKEESEEESEEESVPEVEVIPSQKSKRRVNRTEARTLGTSSGQKTGKRGTLRGILQRLASSSESSSSIVRPPENISTIEFNNERLRPVIGTRPRQGSSVSTSSLHRRLDF